MKKLLSILLITVLCICCIACSDAAKEPENTVAEYLIEYLDEMNNTESVNVVTAYMYAKDGNFVNLEISYGGTTTDEYILVLNTFTNSDQEFLAGTIVSKNDKSLKAAYIKRANAAESLERYESLDDIGNVENIQLDISYINKKLEKYK
ncbi:MAG: hypothetical protein IJ011_02685 [Clostridia bacterium]|nr:hypothetical protein [Clostridia bacterium]